MRKDTRGRFRRIIPGHVSVRTGTAKIVGNTGYTRVWGLVTGSGALYGGHTGRRTKDTMIHLASVGSAVCSSRWLAASW
jgi:hypothetical protein